VSYPENPVTLFLRTNQYSEGCKVLDVVELSALFSVSVHFLVNAVQVFWSPRYLGRNVMFGQLFLQDLHHAFRVLFSFGSLAVYQPVYRAILSRLKMPESLVFEAPFQVPGTKAVRKWGIDL